jgi:crotonobetainyl-CoA:carnitine CoA-transferase CaiB-like acyl-CoA transferase
MTSPGKPLKGTRVVDFTAYWAGPLTAVVMADLGAEVIKVEAPHRIDPFRVYGVALGDVEKPYERSPLFNAANRNKLGITLNLSDDRGRDLFKRLVERSDVVVENFSPRVLPQLGLDYDVLSAVNPAIVLTSISGFGRTGPWRDYVSFAVVGEALSGISSLTGYGGEGVILHGIAPSDPYAGLSAAFATLAALDVAKCTGRGCHVEVSQLEASVPFVADAFMDFALNGRVRGRATNEDSARAPHGCFPARGEDAWVTLSVGNDAQWRGLVEAMGSPGWASEDCFATALLRCRSRARLHELVAQWTARHDKDEVTRLLQSRGVPAAPVRTPSEQLDDPHLGATGFFQQVDHPYAGRHPYSSLPARFAGAYPTIERAGPLLGGDNHYVLAQILGLAQAEIEDLEAAGVTGAPAR